MHHIFEVIIDAAVDIASASAESKSPWPLIIFIGISVIVGLIIYFI